MFFRFAVFVLFFIGAFASNYEEAYQAANLLGLPSEAVYIRSNIDTSFSCVGRNGYYADTANDCQIYHVCLPRVENSETVLHHFSFICPNSTIFSQKTLTCVGSSDYACVGEYSSEDANYVRENDSIRKPFENKIFYTKSFKTSQESVKFAYPTKKVAQFQEVKKAPYKQAQFQEEVKKAPYKQAQFQEVKKYPSQVKKVSYKQYQDEYKHV